MQELKAGGTLPVYLPTHQVPFIRDYVCIVCAIANKNLPPLSTGIHLNEIKLIRTIVKVIDIIFSTRLVD